MTGVRLSPLRNPFQALTSTTLLGLTFREEVRHVFFSCDTADVDTSKVQYLQRLRLSSTKFLYILVCQLLLLERETIMNPVVQNRYLP